MKHVKEYESFDLAMAGLSIAAALKIIYNTIRRNKIVKGVKNRDFEKLEDLINKFRDQKTRIGKIIDNEQISQITYEYGGSDNIIVFILDKENKEFILEWEFTQPVMPFVKYFNNDSIRLDLNDDEIIKIQEIFDNLKSQKFKRMGD